MSARPASRASCRPRRAAAHGGSPPELAPERPRDPLLHLLVGRWSEPRMMWVIPRSRSSTTVASWYVAVPSARASVVPPSRIEPSGSRTAPPRRAQAPRPRHVARLARSGGTGLRPSRSRASRGRRGSPPPRRQRCVGVGVVDPEDETPPFASAIGAVGGGAEGVPEMERARRARREADADIIGPIYRRDRAPARLRRRS